LIINKENKGDKWDSIEDICGLDEDFVDWEERGKGIR
jgi:hypothetical protein